MQHTKTTTDFNFSAFFQLAKDFQSDIREQVCLACDWSEATFYRKFKQPCSYSRAEKAAISRICGDLVRKMMTFIDEEPAPKQ